MYDTLIIGGGLAGLCLADRLSRDGKSFLLLEARPRLGGRISGHNVAGVAFDTGPAWFWPGQLRIAALIQRFGLSRFEQFATGDMLYEDQGGTVQRGAGYASMQGSYRLQGGLSLLIRHLAAGLPQGSVVTDAPVTQLTQTATGLHATTQAGQIHEARKAVLALPPRLARGLTYVPALPAQAQTAMEDTATWMAGHAKAIAVYERPFWRDAGLSGDAMSRRGPMVEIHDASPAENGPYGLFGFLGTPPQHRRDQALMTSAVQAQLERLFGPQAADPMSVVIKDWAFDPFTAMQLDHQPLYAHPHYGLPRALSNLWGGRLVFGGTEVAQEFGGYLEGALEAAELAHGQIGQVL